VKLARRLSLIESSMTLKMTAKAAELKARGVDVVSFTAGEPDFDTPAHIKEAAKRALDEGATRYTNVEGTPRLRAAVAAWFGRAHGVDVRPDEVMVSSGAKQSIFNAFHALLDEGDEVIIPSPCWVSYSAIARLAGARVVLVPSRPEEGFAVRVEDVARAIGPRTRMIVVGSPSNPTGAVYDEATLRALADLVCRYDLVLVTDDIYRTLCYDGARFIQPVAFGPEVRARTVIIDGVSKAYAMTGWRIAFTLAPPAIIQAMATLQGQSVTNAAAVSQAAALAAVEGPVDELDRMRVEFNRRRLSMVRGLRAIPGVLCVEPKGAFYAFPDVSSFLGRRAPDGQRIDDDVALCEYLLEQGRVGLVPGSSFGAPGYVRLSYATSMANVDKGVARMAEALAALRP